MKNSEFIVPNRNLRALTFIGFLFAGSASFAQTTQAEAVKGTEPKTELSEYPTDPVIVPADLKKHTIEQKALVKSAASKEKRILSKILPDYDLIHSF